MHLALYALAFASPEAVQEPAAPPPAVVSTPAPEARARSPGLLVVHLGLRTRSSGPANAALTFSRLLGDLRDSLRRSRNADTALAIALRTMTPAPTQPDRRGAEYDLTLEIGIGPDGFPRLAEVLERLAAGPVSVTEFRLGATPELDDWAKQMLSLAADSAQAAVGGARTVERLGQLALLFLAIRREVRH